MGRGPTSGLIGGQGDPHSGVGIHLSRIVFCRVRFGHVHDFVSQLVLDVS
jgi:hypothetical protein